MIESNHKDAVRENKHIKIDKAIYRIDKVLTRINDICLKVSGSACSNASPEIDSPSVISLEGLLSTGSNRIIDKCEEITMELDRLEEMLF